MSEQMPSTPRQGLMFIIAGPAGSGKTTLCDRLLEEFSELNRIVTATTRQPREGEVNGVDYYFFSNEEFEKKIDAGDFYEHALVHGRHYGTLKSEVKEKLEKGLDIILNIDVQGAAAFRAFAKEDPFLASKLTTIFITPGSMDVIRERLRGRGSDDEAEIERRVKSAVMEMETAHEYDYVLPTTTRGRDFQLISSVYLAEKHKIER